MEMTDGIRQALQEGSDSLRAYYEKAGILVARPAKGSSCTLAVSAKGGNNAENHNHNDIGSMPSSVKVHYGWRSRRSFLLSG